MTAYFELKFYLVATVLSAFIFLKNAEAQVAVPRIVGGVATTIPTNNFLVSVLLNNTFRCGGSLVTSLHVVTAAHCIRGVRPIFLLVRGGSAFSNTGGTLRRVVKNTTPSLFNAATFDMDVGVLKLRAAMNATNISPIPLCTRTLNVGNAVQTYGWGQNSSTNTVLPTQVRTASFPVISNAQCSTRYAGIRTITVNMMCANTTTAKGVCTSDAGGPVVNTGQLCGVIAFDGGCASGNPAVFTRVLSNRVKTFIVNATLT